jgi:hypothetical protein
VNQDVQQSAAPQQSAANTAAPITQNVTQQQVQVCKQIAAAVAAAPPQQVQRMISPPVLAQYAQYGQYSPAAPGAPAAPAPTPTATALPPTGGLPFMDGASALAIGAGALLVVGGLLARRIVR